MSEEKKRGYRQPDTRFNVRVPYYEDDAGSRLVRELAERRGLSVTAFLRDLVRREAKREGVEAPSE